MRAPMSGEESGVCAYTDGLDAAATAENDSDVCERCRSAGGEGVRSDGVEETGALSAGVGTRGGDEGTSRVYSEHVYCQ